MRQMKNDVYDEKSMGDKLKDFHQKIAEEMDLPEWIKELRCPHCVQKLKLNNIRNIGVCFNSRNFGEIAVEYHCEKCGIMDTVYYRESVKNIHDFADYVKNNKRPSSKPVVEEEMYKLRYNNLVERFLKENNHGDD